MPSRANSSAAPSRTANSTSPQVEGLADFVEAETEAQRRQALAQAGGVLSKLYDGWRTRLIEVAALTEAAIDFSDEGDVSATSLAEARKRASVLAAEIAVHLDDKHRGEIVREGFRVALLGAPNAGKSSLLNALARRDAAIVSAEAGTTRDVIEVRLDLAACRSSFPTQPGFARRRATSSAKASVAASPRRVKPISSSGSLKRGDWRSTARHFT